MMGCNLCEYVSHYAETVWLTWVLISRPFTGFTSEFFLLPLYQYGCYAGY
jgi:hypothetical protein